MVILILQEYYMLHIFATEPVPHLRIFELKEENITTIAPYK